MGARTHMSPLVVPSQQTLAAAAASAAAAVAAAARAGRDLPAVTCCAHDIDC